MKLYKKILFSFLLAFALLALSMEAYLYEDGIYFLYLKSFINDFDFNLINQQSENFVKILTINNQTIQHHSIIQTPVLFTFYLIESVVGMLFGHGTTVKGAMTGIILNFFSLFWCHVLASERLREMGYDYNLSDLILIICSSVALHFVGFTVNVIEIFSLPIFLFVLINSMDEAIEEKSEKEHFYFLSAIGVLLLVRLQFVLFLFYYIIKYRRSYKTLLKSSFLLLGVSLISLLNHYKQFGQVFYFPSLYSEVVYDLSFLNIYESFVNGVLGAKGLLINNPILLLLPFFIFITVKSKSKFSLTVLFFLILDLCKTIFIVGEVFEDHLVGRIFLSSLPIFLLVHLMVKKANKTYEKFYGVLLYVVPFYSLYVGIDYLYYFREGHYNYAASSYLSFNGFVDFLFDYITLNFAQVLNNYSVCLALSLIIFITIHYYDFLKRKFHNYIMYICIVYLLMSSISLLTPKVVSTPEGSFKTSNKYLMIAPYVFDIFEVQIVNTKNKELRDRVIKKKEAYNSKISSDVSPDLELNPYK